MTFRFNIQLHFDVTYRKADDMKALEQEVEDLKAKLRKADEEVVSFSRFAAMNLHYLDMLNIAKRRLQGAGMDTSFIDTRSEKWMRGKVKILPD